jgi:hypothetical protein
MLSKALLVFTKYCRVSWWKVWNIIYIRTNSYDSCRACCWWSCQEWHQLDRDFGQDAWLVLWGYFEFCQSVWNCERIVRWKQPTPSGSLPSLCFILQIFIKWRDSIPRQCFVYPNSKFFVQYLQCWLSFYSFKQSWPFRSKKGSIEDLYMPTSIVCHWPGSILAVYSRLEARL